MKSLSNDFYKNLPKKRMGVGVLFFNENDELLILKPTYKNYWSIPGGIIDKNESPQKAGIREVKEEIGLDLKNPRFLCIEYIPDLGKDENLQFIFYGGILDSTQIENIKINNEEISDYKFLKLEEAQKILSEKLKNRIPLCLDALKKKTAIYLEDSNCK